jgi:hypothetical protein
MKIANDIEAEAAITAVEEWLKTYTEPHRPGEKEEAANFVEGETRSAMLARTWSSRLLNASTADGLGGCSLCHF